jgi:ABC-type phosphate transport system permease subunit
MSSSSSSEDSTLEAEEEALTIRIENVRFLLWLASGIVTIFAMGGLLFGSVWVTLGVMLLGAPIGIWLSEEQRKWRHQRLAIRNQRQRAAAEAA